MSSIRLRLLLSGALLAVLVWRIAALERPARSASKSAERLACKWNAVDALVQDAVDNHQIAGAVALLARRGRTAHVRAFGWRDVESETAMTIDTLFRIASMTKPVTSVAALMLVEDGKLHLDDPLSKYIPEFAAPTTIKIGAVNLVYESAEREITIRDLLTHTSGLTYRFWNRQPWSSLYHMGGVCDGQVHGKDDTCADNVRRLAKQPLVFSPGRGWEYGLSSDVLGVVVEAASGQSLADFMRQRIFQPLKMRDTFFIVPREKRERLSSLYLRGLNGKLKRLGDRPLMVGELALSATYPCQEDSKYFSGGTGLVSTAADYTRFLQMLLGGGQSNGVRLLMTKTVEQMTTNQIGYKSNCIHAYGDSYGYGVGIRTESGRGGKAVSAGSYSWGGVFQTFFWVDPKKDVIGTLMTQVLSLGGPSLYQEFQKRTYQCFAN